MVSCQDKGYRKLINFLKSRMFSYITGVQRWKSGNDQEDENITFRSVLIQNSSTVPKHLFIPKILAPTFHSVILTPMCFNLEKTLSLPLLWGINLLKHAAQLSGRKSFTSGQNFCSFLNLSLLLKHHLWLKLFWMWFKGGGRSCLLSLYPLKKSSKIYVGKSRKWKSPNCP